MAEYPAVGEAYQLRFTRRALEDLRCPSGTLPGDMDGVRAVTPWKQIVDEFKTQRTISTQSTGGALHNVGRGDIYPLHGPDGSRAATWYEEDLGVCWFLGFTPEHDYSRFEDRASVGELLPDAFDVATFDLEMEELDFTLRVGPGVRQLVNQALDKPEVPQRGTVGDLLRLDVTAVVVRLPGASLADLYICIRLPLVPDEAQLPPDWPGGSLTVALAEVATGLPAPEMSFDYPATCPDEDGLRQVQHAEELCIAVRSWEPP